MNNTKWITVRTFSSPFEAQLARTCLENAGIEAHVRDEHSAGITPHYVFAMGGVRLDVPETELARAKELLDVPAPPAETVTCPRCGAANGARAADSLGWLSAVIATLFTAVPARPLRGKRRCAACGHGWRK